MLSLNDGDDCYYVVFEGFEVTQSKDDGIITFRNQTDSVLFVFFASTDLGFPMPLDPFEEKKVAAEKMNGTFKISVCPLSDNWVEEANMGTGENITNKLKSAELVITDLW